MRVWAGQGKIIPMLAVFRFVALAVFAAFSWLPTGQAQAPAKPPAQGAAQAPVFKAEEIEQLVAPIALYPDPLVAQILMASTYPLEVVSAARWAKSNPGLKGKQLEDALQLVPWDPSVKSLASFPQVLAMMDQKLDMTQKLGDAFLAQQKEVMAAIQRLRAKADQTGNLKSGKELTVDKKQEGGNTYITIEPTSPDVVYVPAYNPAVVYGTWPYPAYPPYAYYPPGYVPGAAFWGFAAGVAIGAAWNNGNCDWNSGDININNSFNRETNINRGDRGDRAKGGDRGQGGGKWNHSPEHRQGAGYRDQASRDRFGGGQQRPGVDSRESFRGRAEQGRQEIARGGVSDRMSGSGGRGDLGGRGASQQPAGGFGGGDRGGAGNRPSQLPGGGDRGGFGGGDRGGFGGVGGGGAQTRDFSNRGASSRQNSSFGGGGGSRGSMGGGGGGGRGAGGGGGGRGGGGGGRGGGGRR